MSEQILGPFSVVPSQVTALGVAFTPFVNELLRREVATAALGGTDLTTTYLENVGDEGVDAGLIRAAATRYVPEGDSAWQFKRGDLSPSKCGVEIEGAAAALEILRRGGKYILVLGADINFVQKKKRLNALRAKATELGIDLKDDTIEVRNASDLAEWAQEHPSLAVSHLLGGIRHETEDFHEWAGSMGAAASWVDSPSRQDVINKVREAIEQSNHHPARFTSKV